MPLPGSNHNPAAPQPLTWSQWPLQPGQQGPQHAEGRGSSSQRSVIQSNAPRVTTPSPRSFSNSGNNWQNIRATPTEGQRYHAQPAPHNMNMINYRVQSADSRYQYNDPTAMQEANGVTQPVQHETAPPVSQPADFYRKNIDPAAVAGQSYSMQPQNMVHQTYPPAPQQYSPENTTSDRLKEIVKNCSLNSRVRHGAIWIHSGLADFFTQVSNDYSCLADRPDIFLAEYHANTRQTYFRLKVEGGKPNILDHIGPLAAQLLSFEASDESYPPVCWSDKQNESGWVVINLQAFLLTPHTTTATAYDQFQPPRHK